MLPNPALKEAYGEVVWLYVYRDFSRAGQDLLAERISLRFGVTSWPQLFLADPQTLEILTHTGRSVESFMGAVKRTRVDKPRSLAALERTKEGERRAAELEKRGSLKLARKYLDDTDIVARTRAMEIVADKDPKTIVKRAEELLQVPSDPFRYSVCRVLEEAGDAHAARALEAIVTKPKPSLNPNVLRMRAVQALGSCGDGKSVVVIAPFAQSGSYRNGLTRVSIDALVAIAERHKRSWPAVRAALKQGYPEPPPPGDARSMRACVALAKRIHKIVGKKPFPKVYDHKARELLSR